MDTARTSKKFHMHVYICFIANNSTGVRTKSTVKVGNEIKYEY